MKSSYMEGRAYIFKLGWSPVKCFTVFWYHVGICFRCQLEGPKNRRDMLGPMGGVGGSQENTECLAKLATAALYLLCSSCQFCETLCIVIHKLDSFFFPIPGKQWWTWVDLEKIWIMEEFRQKYQQQQESKKTEIPTRFCICPLGSDILHSE